MSSSRLYTIDGRPCCLIRFEFYCEENFKLQVLTYIDKCYIIHKSIVLLKFIYFFMSSPSSEWLTLSQASKILGVHSATLREWADKGLIETFQTPGGHRRFALGDVQAFLALRKKGKGRRGLPALLDRAISHTQSELQ